MMKNDYYSTALRVSYFSIFVNIVLTAVKLLVGFFANSISIITDAVHSFSDLLTTIIVIASISISRRPADSQHPFGHGRVEEVGGLLVSIVLALIGLMFLRKSFIRLFDPASVHVSTLIIVLIGMTALLKLFLGIYTGINAQYIHSPLLSTDALHHYSDFLTSVVVFIGLFFIRAGFLYVDSLMGACVSVIIVAGAVSQGKYFTDALIGKAVSHDTYDAIKKIVVSFPHVESVHDITVHSYGRSRVISLHVVVNHQLSLADAHFLADSIEKKIQRRKLGKCTVHVDLRRKPVRRIKTDIEAAIEEMIKGYPDIKGFHSLQVISAENAILLNLHLLLNKDISLYEAHALSHTASRILKERFDFSQVHIHVEPYEHGTG